MSIGSGPKLLLYSFSKRNWWQRNRSSEHYHSPSLYPSCFAFELKATTNYLTTRAAAATGETWKCPFRPSLSLSLSLSLFYSLFLVWLLSRFSRSENLQLATPQNGPEKPVTGATTVAVILEHPSPIFYLNARNLNFWHSFSSNKL